MDEILAVLRCPTTLERLRWSHEDALISASGLEYRYSEGVACLLPQISGTQENASVREFYEGEGWCEDEGGQFGDTKAFVDTRRASLEYTRKCMARLDRHFRGGGAYLLDAGCGPLPHEEVRRYGRNFQKRVCVDLSVQALKRARQHLGDRGIYVQGDLVKLPLEDNSMDAITCNHVLYQLAPQQQIEAMLELWRVLKPGGLAVIVYYWWPYAALAWRLERLVKALGWEGVQVAVDTKDGPRIFPQERSWFETQQWPFHYSYDVFRVIDNPFMRRYVPEDWRGALFLRILYFLQLAAPSFCGKHGAVPAILIHKPLAEARARA